MLDHIVLNVSDLAASRIFYEQALAPLGIALLGDHEAITGFGGDEGPYFWLAERKALTRNVHVAFRCDDRVTVNLFHQAALAAGGEDNGAPGLREIYHPDYYGAFVLDPDGNNIEAVCHRAE